MTDPLMRQIDRYTDPYTRTYTAWAQFRIDDIEATNEQDAETQAHDIIKTVFPGLADEEWDMDIHAVEEGE